MANMDNLNLSDLDEDDAQRVRDELNAQAANRQTPGRRVRVLNARKLQKLGFWPVVCTVLNRAIGETLSRPSKHCDELTSRISGTGIFVTPAVLLKATGSPGAALLLWMLGVVTSICALLIWLQFALSIPKFRLKDLQEDGTPGETTSMQCVPRSGGEKNYVRNKLLFSMNGDLMQGLTARVRLWI